MILSLENLSKSYASQNEAALQDINLKVDQGKILGIIGKSGAGKSTLLRCLNGLEKPDSGRILFKGNDLNLMESTKLRAVRSQMGVVSQSFNLLSRRTVYENVALPLEFMNVSEAETENKVLKIIEIVGLRDKRDSYPSQLSGGQRQRVAIARALVADVDLLLCDEFTSALDPETTLEILKLLQEINRTFNISIVLVTHDISVIKEICDDVCVLDKGRIVEEGAVTVVFSNPHHPATQSLLSGLFVATLPDFIQSDLHAAPSENCDVVLRLSFSGDSALHPIISLVIHKFEIPVNIIAGSVDHIGTIAIGNLIISFKHDELKTEGILKFLSEYKINAENLGYINWP